MSGFLKLGLGMADAIIYATAKKEVSRIVTSDGLFNWNFYWDGVDVSFYEGNRDEGGE